MDERTILFVLHETNGIGWKSVDLLTKSVGTLQDIPLMNKEDFIKLGLTSRRAEAIEAAFSSTTKIEKQLKAYEDRNIRWMTRYDPEYPELLKHTYDPPWLLYYIGNIALLQSHCLGIVGTRTPTSYGKRVAEDLAYALSHAGMCVVSGMARGIDSSAHKGALRGGGGTIAVLAGQVDFVYPPENRQLFREVAEKGLLISESPLGTPMMKGLFPVRNRIIAGLSLGTMVVEAADRSGSLITANQALSESRDVFCVPGPITSPKSRGAMALIKQGAKLVTSVSDILEEYAHMIKRIEPSYNIPESAASSEWKPLSEEERKVLHLLACEPLSIDELVERTQINFGLLHSVLLSLLMTKRIVQLPGSTYIAL